jgi:hypothetical protein
MLEFESDPDAEFEFFLAEKLGRTVVELGQMPNDEFVRWLVYFGRKAQRQDIEAKKAKATRGRR